MFYSTYEYHFSREFCWTIYFNYYINITSYKAVYIDISHTWFMSVTSLVKGHLKMAIDEWMILSAVEERFFKEFGWHEWLRTWNNWLSICLAASVLSAILCSCALSSGIWMHRCNQIELVLRAPLQAWDVLDILPFIYVCRRIKVIYPRKTCK